LVLSFKKERLFLKKPQRIFANFILCAALLSGCAMPPRQCRVTPVAFMRIMFLHGVIPAFNAEMNGKPIRMLLDTGAGISTVTPRAVKAAHLPAYPSYAVRLSGTGGTVSVPMATVGNFRIGTASGFVLHFAVASIFGTWHPFDGAVGGIFGADILRNYDIDLDFPAHQVILIAVRHCRSTIP
jgi:hypothetical protein